MNQSSSTPEPGDTSAHDQMGEGRTATVAQRALVVALVALLSVSASTEDQELSGGGPIALAAVTLGFVISYFFPRLLLRIATIVGALTLTSLPIVLPFFIFSSNPVLVDLRASLCVAALTGGCCAGYVLRRGRRDGDWTLP
ncbi:hypothetical protein EEW87_001985 [Janibacter melonis]|uniref:Uncharacterized protein n=1 Tax=Janibacter melonis TaxID=262209 RepID=A0A5P8FJA9_9MICO|nr:hypothetical protein [Janibacter melonis]QFQ29358.2 hypothetical protein EEW87_001985 [Janibacter melonis]